MSKKSEDALRRRDLKALASLAAQGTALPVKPDLTAVLTACQQLKNSVFNVQDEESMPLCMSAFCPEPIRMGIMKLFSYAVREVADWRLRARPLWEAPMLLITRLMADFLRHAVQLPRNANLNGVFGLIVSTDLLPFISKVLATTTDKALAEQAATFAQQPGVVMEMAALLSSLLRLVSYCGSESRVQGLLKALHSSLVTEHTARTVVRLVAVCSRTASSHGKSALNECAVLAAHWELYLATCRGSNEPESLRKWAADTLSGPALQHLLLLHLVSQLCAADGGPDYGTPPEVRLPAVYMDAVGGRLELRTAGGSNTPGGPGSASQRQQQQQHPSFLNTMQLCNIFIFWFDCLNDVVPRQQQTPSRRTVPPVPDAAVRRLCVRAADAANMQLEAGVTGAAAEAASAAAAAAVTPVAAHPSPAAAPTAAGGSRPCTAAAAPRTGAKRTVAEGSGATGAAGAASGSSSAGQREVRQPCGPPLDPSLCGWLAMRAMMCAFATMPAPVNGGEYVGMARLWRPVIRTVRGFLTSEGREQLGKEKALRYLEFLRPRFSRLTPEALVAPSPPRGVAAALAAGYTPCLEALLRSTFGGSSPFEANTTAQSLLNHFGPFPAVGNLLVFGDPLPTASLLATGAKLLQRVATQAATAKQEASPAARRQRADLLESLAGLSDVGSLVPGLGSFLRCGFASSSSSSVLAGAPEPFWWLRDDFFPSSAPSGPASAAGSRPVSVSAAAAASASGSCVGGGGGGGGGGGADGGGDGVGGRNPPAWRTPATQLLVLTTFTFQRWMPAVARANRSCQTMLAGTIVCWLSTMVDAFLACADHAATDPRFAAAAASWRRLLLQDVDVLGVVCEELSFLARYWAEGGDTTAMAGVLLNLLPNILFLSLSDVHAVISAPLKPAAGPLPGGLAGLPALAVLQVVLGPEGCTAHAATLELLETLCPGRPVVLAKKEQGTPEPLLPRLLPPPCVVRFALGGWAPCSNPHCENLEGDSEAGLGLSRCAGRCGGAVAYCCRGCQQAHWKAGHKGECGRKK